MMSKQKRPKLDDRVEFQYRGRLRVGTVIAVATPGVYFIVEMDHPKQGVRRTWDMEKQQIRIGLSRIVRIISKEGT